MRFKLTAPLVDDGHRRNGGSITQRAEGPAKHVLCQILNVVDVFAQTAAVVEAGKRLFEPVSAFTAGDAPAATFMLIELHHAQCKLDHTGLVVEYHDTA